MEYLLETIGIVVIFGGLVYLANIANQRSDLQPLFYVVMVSLNGLLALVGLVAMVTSDNADTFWGGVGFVITGALATFPLFAPIRYSLVGIFPPKRINLTPQPVAAPTLNPAWMPFPMLSDDEITYLPHPDAVNPSPTTTPTPVDNELIGFDPDSMVHLLALVLMIFVLGGQSALFVLGGGLEGYAESVEVNFASLLANFIPFIILSLLGVGWLSRRSWSQTRRRLGLTLPTFGEIGVGIGAAVGLFFVQAMLGMLWLLIVGQETFESQTEASGAIADSIDTVWLAFAVAFTAGVGEEIAFRGALQPIFGLWWTAIFFVAVHMQYTLTPAALIILVVAVAFGYLRRYYSLYTVIIAHFLYNFIPLLLNVWLG